MFTFYVIPPYWYDTGGWNPSSSKTQTYLFYMVSIMDTEEPGHQQPWYLLCWMGLIWSPHINSLRPRQNRCHFADVFKGNFLNENVWIPIKISLKFVSIGPINNIPALVQIMAWCRTGNKPLSEPMMTQFNDACMRQWVKGWCLSITHYTITHWGLNKMAAIYSPHIFKCIFVKETLFILSSLEFLRVWLTNTCYNHHWFRLRAWHLIGSKPLSEPVLNCILFTQKYWSQSQAYPVYTSVRIWINKYKKSDFQIYPTILSFPIPQWLSASVQGILQPLFTKSSLKITYLNFI